MEVEIVSVGGVQNSGISQVIKFLNNNISAQKSEYSLPEFNKNKIKFEDITASEIAAVQAMVVQDVIDDKGSVDSIWSDAQFKEVFDSPLEFLDLDKISISISATDDKSQLILARFVMRFMQTKQDKIAEAVKILQNNPELKEAVRQVLDGLDDDGKSLKIFDKVFSPIAEQVTESPKQPESGVIATPITQQQNLTTPIENPADSDVPVAVGGRLFATIDGINFITNGALAAVRTVTATTEALALNVPLASDNEDGLKDKLANAEQARHQGDHIRRKGQGMRAQIYDGKEATRYEIGDERFDFFNQRGYIDKEGLVKNSVLLFAKIDIKGDNIRIHFNRENSELVALYSEMTQHYINKGFNKMDAKKQAREAIADLICRAYVVNEADKADVKVDEMIDAADKLIQKATKQIDAINVKIIELQKIATKELFRTVIEGAGIFLPKIFGSTDLAITAAQLVLAEMMKNEGQKDISTRKILGDILTENLLKSFNDLKNRLIEMKADPVVVRAVWNILSAIDPKGLVASNFHKKANQPVMAR